MFLQLMKEEKERDEGKEADEEGLIEDPVL